MKTKEIIDLRGFGVRIHYNNKANKDEKELLENINSKWIALAFVSEDDENHFAINYIISELPNENILIHNFGDGHILYVYTKKLSIEEFYYITYRLYSIK